MYQYEQDVLGASYFGPVAGSPLVPPEVVTIYFVVFFIILAVVYFILHQKRKPVHIKHKVQLLVVTALVLKLFVVIGGGFVAAYWLVPRPGIQNITPLDNSKGHEVTKKLEIIFDRPVSRNDLAKNITPEVPGVWLFEDSLYTTHLYRKLVFYPTVSFKPSTQYTVTLSNIKNVIGTSDGYDQSFTFVTQDPPGVSSVFPKNGDSDIEIGANLRIELSQPNDRVSEFDFSVSPSHPIEVRLDPTKKIYTLLPKEPFKQGTKYQLTINKTDLSYNLPTNTIIERGDTTQVYDGSFTTKDAPGIESFTVSETNFLPTDPVVIIFSQAMDKTSIQNNFSITPSVTGQFIWKDDKELTFKPVSLDFETKYTVKIAKGTKSLPSGFIENDVVKTFTTIGAAKVTESYPVDKWDAVSIDAPIKITFDQEVDKTSAESQFNIQPKIDGEFTWENNTLIFQPSSPFKYSTTYNVQLKPGIKSVHGLDSTQDFSMTFATQEQTVKLAVPVMLQQHGLSCEVAALRMALEFRGVKVSEETLLSKVGVDNTPHNGDIWGDPYEAFVGNVDGKQMVDGYGVYWGPIERVAKEYRDAEDFEGWDVSSLTKAISEGNPVVIWVYSSSGWPTSWHTPGGKLIPAMRDEHAVTAVGYVGPSNNPSQLIINDPLHGQVYWARDLFDKKWASLGRSGVVVY